MANSPLRPSTGLFDEQDYVEATLPVTADVRRGLRSAAAGMSAGFTADEALRAELAGNPEFATMRDNALRSAQTAQLNAPRVRSLRDVTGVGDTIDFLQGGTPQAALSMAPSLAAAVATRGRSALSSFAGAAVPAYWQERGETALGQYEDPTLAAAPVEQRDSAATAKAVVNAALESVVPAGLAHTLLKAPTKSLARDVAGNMVEEGVTEGLQTVTGALADQSIDPTKQIDPWEVLDSTVLGAAGGGTVGGTVSAANRAADTLLKHFPPTKESAADPLVLGDQDPTLAGATPEETEANILRRDQENTANAAALAESILTDPEADPVLKEKIASFGGDYSNPEAQAFVGQTVQAQDMGAKIKSSLSDLIDMGKSAFKAVSDKVIKQNLQDTTPAEQATFNKLVFDNLTDVAKTDPLVRAQLPEVANTLLAFAARTGEITKKDVQAMTRLNDHLGTLFQDPDALVEQLSTYAGLARPEDSFLARVKKVNTAQADMAQPNSFLFTALTDEAKNTLKQPQLKQLAKMVDGFKDQDSDSALEALSAAFGSPDAAKTVLDYYQQQNNSQFAVDEEDIAGLTEQDTAELTASYRQPNPNRPFLRGRDDALVSERAKTEGTNARVGSLAEYTKLKGESLSGKAKSVRADLIKRIEAESQRDTASVKAKIALLEMQPELTSDQRTELANLKARKTENRPGLKILREELKAQDDAATLAKKEGRNASEARLALYDTVMRPEEETQASDENVAKYRGLLDKLPDPTSGSPNERAKKRQQVEDIKATAIGFKMKGKSQPMYLSAESMVHSTKGKGSVAQRFSEAVASVLARGDVEGIAGEISPDTIIVRGKNGSEPIRYGDLTPKKGAPLPKPKSKTPTASSDPVGAEILSRVEKDYPFDDYESFSANHAREEQDAGRYAEDGAVEIAYAEHQLQVLEERAAELEALEEPQLAAKVQDRIAKATARLNELTEKYEARTFEEDTGLPIGVEKRGLNPEASNEAKEKAQEKTKQSSMDPPKQARIGEIDQQAIIDEVLRIRGKDVKVAFETFASIGASGEFTMNKDKTERLIRIAVNSLNPMSVAWHESLHDFFAMLGGEPATRKLKQDLLDAASAPHVVKKLRELLADHPNALKQIESDPEERLAYMYQFWAEGAIKLGPTGTGIFRKFMDMVHKILGTMPKDQKLDELLTALHIGKFTEPSLVSSVLEDLRAETIGDKLTAVSRPIAKAVEALMTSTTDRLRNTKIEALVEIADLFHRETDREKGGLPFLQARSQAVGKNLNRLQKMLENTTAVERRSALENMQAMLPPASPLEVAIKEHLDDLHAYMVESGVKRFDKERKRWVPMRKVMEYFPRSWDKNTISARRDEFEAHVAAFVGKAQAKATADAIINGDGSIDLAEDEHHLGFTPFAKAVEDRKLSFINASNAKLFTNFMNKDLTDTLTTYIQQAVHRAEYAKVFGNAGEILQQKFEEAKKQGATNEEIEMAQKATMALEGTLGFDFNPRLKQLMSGIMTYENIVLLPLALFTSLSDPVGIALRSNDMKEAGKAFMTGIKGIAEAFAGAKPSETEEMAKLLGIIDEQNMLEAMGQVYNSMHMSKTMKKINSKFFRYNGMELWNKRMRIAATSAAQRFIAKNVDNKRYMDELGITRADVFEMKDGTIALTKDQLIKEGAQMPVLQGGYTRLYRGEGKGTAGTSTVGGDWFTTDKAKAEKYGDLSYVDVSAKELGMSFAQGHGGKDEYVMGSSPAIRNRVKPVEDVEAIEKRLHAAVYKFVDGGVLRPNAAHRPIWGSDPRFQLLFHLKQFTYSFQNTILKRVGEEFKHGNVSPAVILLSYVPFVFASDLIRGSLTGTLKTNTDLLTAFSQAVARSGIMGTGAFSGSAVGDAAHGNIPGVSLLGPTFEHLMTLVDGLLGNTSRVLERSVPGGSALRGVL